MTDSRKGSEVNRFGYHRIKVFNNHFIGSVTISLVLLLAGSFKGAPLNWLGFVLVTSCWFNLYLLKRFKNENSFPCFILYEGGIEISFPHKNEKVWYQWGDLIKVRLVSPFERKSRGMLKFLEGRPGFELTFEDNVKIMVYQRMNGYHEFYKCLATLNIKGVEDKLPIYDRLNMYGQSIDGEMCSINNYGEPQRYIDIIP